MGSDLQHLKLETFCRALNLPLLPFLFLFIFPTQFFNFNFSGRFPTTRYLSRETKDPQEESNKGILLAVYKPPLTGFSQEPCDVGNEGSYSQFPTLQIRRLRQK